MRTTQPWTVSLPPMLIKEAERVAKEEDRTRSELVREALRMYIEERRWRKLQRQTAIKARALGIRTEEDVDRLVHSVRKRSAAIGSLETKSICSLFGPFVEPTLSPRLNSWISSDLPSSSYDHDPLLPIRRWLGRRPPGG